MNSEPLYVDADRWDRILEATDGVANVCFQCGTCTARCPYGLVDDEPISVRELMRQTQLGLDGSHSDLYRCLTCIECATNCPRGVDITGAVLGLKEVAFETGDAPGQLEQALWSVYEEDNPWERPSGDRGEWLTGVPNEPTVSVGGQADVLYYVGCTPSYDPALQSVPVSIVQLLDAAGVDFTVLGNEEVCCGDVVRQTGEPEFFTQLAERNMNTFEETGAETIITTSPHCAETFTDGYELTATVLHYTEFLDALVSSGKLQFQPLNQTVTYHDPCYLARGRSIVEAPRRLLDAAGVGINELDPSDVDTLCCGGGGGNMWNEHDLEERFADRRATQASKTGADALVTACPYCVQTLQDGVKNSQAELPVRELSTVLFEALEPGLSADGETKP